MHIKLVFSALTAALVMALAASGSSARNISISHGELVNAEWRQLRFESGGAVATECDVTFEGSFHYRTFIKLRESELGDITRATVNNCNTGSATVLTTSLPWHIRYQGFEGTLPNITGLRVRLILDDFVIKERIFGTTCSIRTTTAEPGEMVFRLSAGTANRLVTGLTSDTNARIRCGILNGDFNGTAQVRELPNGNTNVLVRLI